jgi:hypothetical protein
MNWDDVARACLALPGTTEAVSARGRRRWLVRGRTFARDRPLHRVDLAELGESAPTGPILVAYVPDVGAREALIAAEPQVYFTTRHFARVPVVQCRLAALDERSLIELVGEAWASRAPSRLVMARRFPGRPHR